jgi:hypothetical protein
MTAGTLVRWTHPDDQPIGIVLEVISDPRSFQNGCLIIFWGSDRTHPNGHRGIYPAEHKYMKVISETR